MSEPHRPEVSFVTRILTHYRVPFHERVRTLLAAENVDYRVIHGQPAPSEAAKGDLGELAWAERVHNLPLFGREKLVWQPILTKVRSSDLVILGQESQLLANYPLQLFRKAGSKIALFGHGRNFQSRRPDGLAERWKRFWATRCDWWFAYTQETRRHLEALGFPRDRITVFDNAIDTSDLRHTAEGLTDDDVAAVIAALGMRGRNVAIYVGGLYPDKRLDFLVAAADLVHEEVPDFELLVVGGGVDFEKLGAMAEPRPYLFVAGPRFGREKAALMRAAKLFAMPGLVGLAVLDAGTLGLPVVTTAWPWHSPEIVYLEHAANGVIVEEWRDPAAYARAMVALLRDETRRAKLAQGAQAGAGRYTIEAMAEKFAQGVLAALEEGRR